MILKFIVNIIGMIITAIINIVSIFMPITELGQVITPFITQILSITQQALNFMYLIFGDTIIIITPSLIALLITKYTIVPIIEICRGFFISASE